MMEKADYTEERWEKRHADIITDYNYEQVKHKTEGQTEMDVIQDN